MQNRARRAPLFLPADSRRKAEKAAGLQTDAIIFDLEDAVALDQKAAARETLAGYFAELDFGPRERIVRVNASESADCEADVQTAVEAGADVLMLPKATGAGDMKQLDAWMQRAETRAGRPSGDVGLIALVETAAGLVQLRDLCEAGAERLVALAFGAEDLCGDIGAVRARAPELVNHGRAQIVMHAAAYGLGALDTPWIDLADLEGLAAETRQIADLGFSGKLAIHPKQVAAIHGALAPGSDELDDAERLIAAFDAHQADGAGVFAFEGRMVDMPMVRAARHLLARAGMKSAG